MWEKVRQVIFEDRRRMISDVFNVRDLVDYMPAHLTEDVNRRTAAKFVPPLLNDD